jgi:ABC-2 type transport system ATP-binding protein
VTAFLGPNGAGKTTTIQCALNLQSCDRGRVSVLGRDSRKIGPEELRQIGYVSENQELPLWMTVEQFLNYCRPMYPKWDRDFEKNFVGISTYPVKPDYVTFPVECE